MQAWSDIQTYLLAAAVVAVLGGFFWFVVSAFIGSGRRIAEILDGSSARRRAALEREIKFGKDPLWLRALRVLFIALGIGLVPVLFWYKFRP